MAAWTRCRLMRRKLIVALVVLIAIIGVRDFILAPPEANEAPVPAPSKESSNSVDLGTSAPGGVAGGANSDEKAMTEEGELLLEQAALKFSEAISNAGACFQISMYPSGPQTPPTLAEWLLALRNELGEPSVSTEDWSITTIETPTGERRNIRFEIDYSDAGNVEQRLTYSVQKSDGSVEMLPLDEEKASNPTETFKATLESDGKVISREKAQRFYFESGDEIIVTEKDGYLVELEMSRRGKTFSCRPFDPQLSTCRCR